MMSSSITRRECFKILDLPPDATSDFHNPTLNDDSDSDDEGFSFLDLLLLFQREMLREELRRREAMRREAFFRTLFGVPLFSPRMRTYEDDDDDFFFMNNNVFRPKYSDRAHQQPASSDQSTSGERRYHQTRPQVHTPSSNYRQRKQRPPSPPWASYTPHRSREQPQRATPRRSENTKPAGQPKADCGPSENSHNFSYRSYKSQQHDVRPESGEATPDPPLDAQPQHPRPSEPAKHAPQEDATSPAEELSQGTGETVSKVADSEWSQRSNAFTKSYQNKLWRKPQKAPAYVVSTPAKMTKKQLLAQHNRRQKEANDIGIELRAKAEANMKLKEQLKNNVKGKGNIA
ncbi:uncharacterized protein LOC110983916 isoform X2 [Acanthaster planci]|uniref:Uncharacterized protein LOC110983916 isoform X2 n=1 Tax=Acanthaster planci TaxID=133434 RepID=A0A8B7Z3C7_ACAPL|nr:uncharacterized protein LOC110983916 isoform X2 [Acanthaster planci]